MYKWLVILCLFLWKTPVIAQDSLHLKYENYRHRLMTGFLKRGTGPGSMIPMSRRWPGKHCMDGYYLDGTCGGLTRNPDESGMLDWVDGTIHIGYLLAVLGSELEVNARKGLSLDTTIMDLRNTLRTIDRLDSGGEVKYGREPVLNGFMLRDDVPTDIHRHFPGYGCGRAQLFCNRSIRDGNMPSQDQFINLLFGLSFCKKYLEKNSAKHPEIPELIIHVKEISTRIASFLLVNDWVIRDPDGYVVPIGSGAVGYSYGISQSLKYVTGKKQGNFTSDVTGYFLWRSLVSINYQPGNALHNEVNLSMQLALMAMTGVKRDKTFRDLCTRSHEYVFLLAEKLLHDKKMTETPELYRYLLRIAPEKGPCNNAPDCENVNEWKSENRWFHPNSINGYEYEGGAEFNGLDFMLLYNLYFLAFEGE